MPDIMISYARADAYDFAVQLRQNLADVGLDVWLDTSEIKGGSQWLKSIQEAILNSKLVLAVRTPGGTESSWVKRERLLALNERIPVLPVLLLDGSNDLELIDLQPIDFRKDFDLALKALLSEIRSYVSGTHNKQADRRLLELAYLGKILAQFSVWSEIYTPMAGVAQLNQDLVAPTAIQTKATTIDPIFVNLVEKTFNKTDKVEEPPQEKNYNDLLVAIEDIRQLVLLGDPGSGKTTTLWRLSVLFAERVKLDAQLPIPIFLRLEEFSGYNDAFDSIQKQLGDLGVHLQSLLNEKRIALFLDGLNEIPRESKAQSVSLLRELVNRCKADDLVCVITCRELDYTTDLNLGIEQQLRVKPLDALQIKQFIGNYISSPKPKADELFWKLAGDKAINYWKQFVEVIGDYPDIFWVKPELPAGQQWGYGNVTWGQWLQLRNDPRNIISLATNPYMLYMLTQVFVMRGSIPQNRGTLFELFISYLLTHREGVDETTYHELRRKFSNLAYAIQLSDKGLRVDKRRALDFLDDEQSLYLAKSANILTGTEDIRFSHQLLQEYFAAIRLDEERKQGIPAVQFFPKAHWWLPQGWEETALLMAGLYNDDVSPILDWLKESQPELTARCAVESGSTVPRGTYQRLKLADLWLAYLKNNPADSDPLEAAAVGRALGLLDLDQREGVSIASNGLPDIEWCKVDAGEFIMGTDRLFDTMASDNEPDAAKIILPSFEISKYLITYTQYQTFIDAKDGFSNPHWWMNLDVPDEYRLVPGEQAFKYWNHPRDNVSWYDAVAFCRWLSDKMGKVIRLPTEAEWEKSARGMTGLIFPYGNTFEIRKANTILTHIGETSAVGIFPDGISPCGALDMSGNIWEWCLSEWRDPYEHHTADKVNLQRNRARVLRGGSWRNGADFARTTVRRPHFPRFRSLAYGFRILCEKD